MADEFSDAGAQARLDALRKSLGELSTDLSRDLRDAKELQAQQTQKDQRAERRVAREERVERDKKARTRGTRGTGEEPVADTERKARAEGRRLTLGQQRAEVEERIAAAQAKGAQAAQREQLYRPPERRTRTAAEIRAARGIPDIEVARRGTVSADEILQRRRDLGQPAIQPKGAAAALLPDEARNITETIGGYQRKAAAISDVSDEQAQAINRANELARVEAVGNARMQQSGAAIGVSADALRRHGALTTEFISAAKRGQVDIRELGYQVGATIGKFAGWTAAGAAVFAVAGAMSQLGRGAIDSLDGVNQLQRIIPNLNTEKAQQQFRDLSAEFNLPIGEVADVAYGMSKIFNDQTDAIKGTEAALFAQKVGELEAADATKYLTSITQGFHLEASQLMPVMDAINQVTNDFGGNVGQLTAGVGQASGSFRAAGGTWRELISLIETGAKVTGRTGPEIGTALRRTSEIISRPERRANIVELLGIDPRDASVTEVLARAAKVIERAGPDLRSRVLRAITTPELASGRILPILQNFDLFRNIEQSAAKSKSRGSAQRELERTLKAPSEEAGKFVNNLQRVGSALAQAGALDPFVLVLRGINETLSLATNLLEVFNAFPKPLRSAAFFLAQAAAGIAILRRFDAGRVLPDSFPGSRALRRSPEALERAQISRGMRDFQSLAAQPAQRDAAIQLHTANQEARRLALQYADDVEKGFPDEEAKSQAATRVNAANDNAVRALRNYEFAAVENARVQQQIANFERDASRHGARKAAAMHGIVYTPGTLESAAPVVPGQIGGAGPSATPTGVAAAAQGRRLQIAAEAMRRDASLFDRAGFATYAAMGRAGEAMGDAGARLTTRAGSLRGSIARMNELSGPAGPIEALFIGVTVGLTTYEIISKQLDENSREIERLFEGGAAEMRAKAKRADRAPNLLEKLQTEFAETWNEQLGVVTGVEAVSPEQGRVDAADLARRQAQQLDRDQKKGQKLNSVDIKANLGRRLAAAGRDRGAIDRAEEQFWTEYNTSWAATVEPNKEKAKAALESMERFGRGRLSDAKAAVGDLNRALDEIVDPAGLTGFVQRTGVAVRKRGLTGGLVRRAGAAQARAAELALHATPEEAETLFQAADQAEQIVMEEAQKRLQRIVEYARTPAEAGAARAQFIRTVRRDMLGGFEDRIKHLRGKVADRKRAIDRIDEDIDAADPTPSHGSDVQGAVRDRRDQLTGRLKRLHNQQTENKDRIKALRRQLRSQREEFDAIVKEQRRAQLETELASFDARTERLQSETADPLAQARILAARLPQRIERLRRAFDQGVATQDQLDRAIAQNNQAQQQLAQQQLSRFQSGQQVATARFAVGATQGQLLRRQLADAQRYAGQVRSQLGNVDPEAYDRAMEQVYQSQKALADYLEEQGKALLDSQERYALSGTNDPVQQNRIKLRYSNLRMRRFPGKTRSERLDQRATQRENERALVESRQQDYLDEQQFLFDMGSITKETYTRRIENFLRSHKNLRKTNRDLWRDLRRQLHQLKNEDESGEDFQLNLSDLRLPTAYEVRRGLSQGVRAASRASGLHITSAPQIDVNVNIDRRGEVDVSAIDRTTGGSVRAAARAGGVIG